MQELPDKSPDDPENVKVNALILNYIFTGTLVQFLSRYKNS